MNNFDLSKNYFEMALVFFEKSKFLEAEKYFALSNKLTPGRLSVLINLSATLIKLNKYDNAQKIITEIYKEHPNNVVNHLNQGNLYLKLHDLHAALNEFLTVINLDPSYPEGLNNYGFVLQRLGLYTDALNYYNKAIQINGNYVEAFYNKSQCLIKLKRYAEAQQVLESALEINYEYDDLLMTYASLLQQICDWHNFKDVSENIKELLYLGNNISSVFCLLSIYDEPQLHLQAAKNYSSLEFPEENSLNPIIVKHNKKIHLGYFSADFHNHATAYLMAELFELHDKSFFEIHAFSFGPDNQDSMRERIKNSVDYFHDVRDLDDSEITLLSRNYNINIAIDLKGYTFDCRPGIFAKRAAPIQVSYLGYPGTMGSNYIDYIIADHTLIPANNQNNYTEKIVFLPNSYQVNDSKRTISNIIPKKLDENLPDNAFVFCCFNNSYKILPEVFSIWMDILNKIDNSVLWLLNENCLATRNLLKEAANRGISPDRIIFAERKKLPEHLSRHSLADLFLDTLPYNAHTTASDALWAGLPVLTCSGKTFASRVSASLLNAIKVPELITENLVDYQETAIYLALNPDKLSMIKEKINKNILSAPLFNTKLFTKNIEEAYFRMHEININNLSPRNINVL